jgi:uncharacterized protein YndB with AHSA1/START domain
MTDARAPASTRTSRIIKAPREALYRAFTDPAALAVWLSPEGMTEQVYRGKTSEREDRFTARFVELRFQQESYNR